MVEQKIVHMGQKKCMEDKSIFLEGGHLAPKFNITSYHKFDAKYFHVKQFLSENQYFLGKLQKTVQEDPNV